ncbi:MAG: hypothetical protein AAGD22_17360 [Verrucomicrobiota bacterium]
MSRIVVIATGGVLVLGAVVYLVLLDLGEGRRGLSEKRQELESTAAPPFKEAEATGDGRIQYQWPTAPEKTRTHALAEVDRGTLLNGYKPGEHQVSAEDPRVYRSGDGTTHFLPMVEMARGLHDRTRLPVEDLEILDAVVGTYRSIFRENPVAGLNHEVTEVLAGKNRKHVVLIEPGHPAINGMGELTDRWGTPYRFHGISSQRMEFLSAGPDRKFGTADDLNLGGDS